MSEKDTTTAVAPRFYTLQELADLGVGSESTLRKAIKEGRLSFHGVSSINNYSMRKVQRNTARNRQHMGVHRNTYRFCGKPIGRVAKNRCARKT